MNKENHKAGPSPAPFHLIVTLLVCTGAAGMLATQWSFAHDPTSDLSLSTLYDRATMLQQITDPVQRDQMCIPLSATGRALDRALQPDARIFLTNMLGPTNAPNMGFYYFLRNYLFPREVDISLDGKGVFVKDGCDGIPCDSPGFYNPTGMI